MFRNQYDQDALTWSPQGRLHQVEYAMEAVKQGSTVVACGNERASAVAALKRKQSELSSVQDKIFKINSSTGAAISGLATDGANLIRALREESVRSELIFERIPEVGRLANLMGKTSHISFGATSSRPSGVGLLIFGQGDQGCQIFQLCPSGVIEQVSCCAIGARAQSARTYFEKNIASVQVADVDQLIKMAIAALSECVADPSVLSPSTCEVAVICQRQFQLKTAEELSGYLV